MTRSKSEPSAFFQAAAGAVGLTLLSAACGGCLTPKIKYEAEAAPRSVQAVQEEARGRFLYYTGDRRVPGELESIVRLYRRADGAEVLLLSMVHFADREFYSAVAKRLARTDVVLLEGSADAVIAGVAAAERSATRDAARIFEALDLVPQPESARIGPRGPRYLRGDVPQRELAARVAAVHNTGAAWSPQEFPSGVFNWDRFWYALIGRTEAFRRTWRHLFATRLKPMEERAVREILIDPRNEAVLRRLDEVLRARKGAGVRFRVAVPWGSEHMPGIERGLLARRFAPVGVERLVAWRVRSYEAP